MYKPKPYLYSTLFTHAHKHTLIEQVLSLLFCLPMLPLVQNLNKGPVVYKHHPFFSLSQHYNLHTCLNVSECRVHKPITWIRITRASIQKDFCLHSLLSCCTQSACIELHHEKYEQHKKQKSPDVVILRWCCTAYKEYIYMYVHTKHLL